MIFFHIKSRQLLLWKYRPNIYRYYNIEWRVVEHKIEENMLNAFLVHIHHRPTGKRSTVTLTAENVKELNNFLRAEITNAGLNNWHDLN